MGFGNKKRRQAFIWVGIAVLIIGLFFLISSGSEASNVSGHAILNGQQDPGVLFKPVSQGNYNGWSAKGCTSGSKWMCVDDAVLNISDYLYSSSKNVKDTFKFGKSGLTSELIYNLTLTYYAKAYSSSKKQILPLFRIGGRDYLGGVISLGTDYTFVSQTFVANPATGAAWTVADIDNLDAGMVTANNNNGGAYVAFVSVDVKYKPLCVPTNEICNNKDDDCDGMIDEGLSQACGVSNVGACSFGTQTCSAGNWSSCVGNIDPTPEVCDGIIDNDCDGVVDNGCACINSQIKNCGVFNVGECKFGTETCIGGNWSSCVGNIDPTIEACNNKDDDCDGMIDNNLSIVCGVSNVGACSFGTQTCSAGNWSSCVGNIDPVPEVCDGIIDNDCDGMIDEGCECVDGFIQSCGSNIGECRLGIQTCVGGMWGACINDIGPSTEICDGKDNNCNNITDESLPITCGASSQCGSASWIGPAFCQGGNVYRNWITYMCNSAGSCFSSCSSNTTAYFYQGCPNGCSDGVCIPAANNSCYDTDYGFYPLIYGNVSGLLSGYPYAYKDFCANSNILLEYYCSGSTPMNSTVYCTAVNATQCWLGRCV